MTAAWLGPLPDPHENCGHQWECHQCRRPVCARCDPSPAEYLHCAECHWFIGPRTTPGPDPREVGTA